MSVNNVEIEGAIDHLNRNYGRLTRAGFECGYGYRKGSFLLFMESDYDTIREVMKEISMLYDKMKTPSRVCGTLHIKRHVQNFRRQVDSIYKIRDPLYINHGCVIVALFLLGYGMKVHGTVCLVNIRMKPIEKILQ